MRWNVHWRLMSLACMHVCRMVHTGWRKLHGLVGGAFPAPAHVSVACSLHACPPTPPATVARVRNAGASVGPRIIPLEAVYVIFNVGCA